MRNRAERFGGLRGFACDDSQIKLRHLCGVRCGAKIRMKFVRSRNGNSALIKSACVLGPPDVRPGLGDSCQVSSVEASDGSATDNANALHHFHWAAARGSELRLA